MLKKLSLTLILFSSIFMSASFAKEVQNDNLNHLLKKSQLEKYCTSNGNKTNTRIKISLPNGDFFYGTITCDIEKNT